MMRDRKPWDVWGTVGVVGALASFLGLVSTVRWGAMPGVAVWIVGTGVVAGAAHFRGRSSERDESN